MRNSKRIEREKTGNAQRDENIDRMAKQRSERNNLIFLKAYLNRDFSYMQSLYFEEGLSDRINNRDLKGETIIHHIIYG